MNFQQLEYIIAVDRYQHFAKAAEHCHVTQATLSAMIIKLEEELELVIFDRRRQPVITTDEGKKIIAKAQSILNVQSDMHKVHESDPSLIQGVLRIGIIPTIANSLLPIILKPLMEDFPNLQLNAVEVTTDEIIRQLKNDQLDAGILATPLHDKAIEEVIMYHEAMMVYGIQNKQHDFVLPNDLESENIWLLEEGHCFRNQSKTICNVREKQNQPENFRFEGSSFETLLNLTDQFGGFTLIPELYYKSMPSKRKNKTVDFVKPIPVREVSMVYYRPFAKKRIIHGISEKIASLLKRQLSASKLAKEEMTIVGI